MELEGKKYGMKEKVLVVFPFCHNFFLKGPLGRVIKTLDLVMKCEQPVCSKRKLFLDFLEMKAFADNKINVTQKFVFGTVENTVRI